MPETAASLEEQTWDWGKTGNSTVKYYYAMANTTTAQREYPVLSHTTRVPGWKQYEWPELIEFRRYKHPDAPYASEPGNERTTEAGSC